ncbi:protein O-glucosyltransferase 2-like [Ruditapes philippinarum]|uniref:protein O-glucosyltransferase 2-like n=1 Tax=Ruditapes philippinarum TaxID=129788 RepID=UPI00295A5F5D|nr:protein O-glucosyltransferase 2-like [Ruditapes philippinarum]
MYSYMFACLLIFLTSIETSSALRTEHVLDLQKTRVWGPGLESDFFLPVRYFFIQAVSENGDNITESIGEKPFEVSLSSAGQNRVRVYLQVLDKQDGMYIVRFRIFSTLENVKISVTFNGKDVAQSPYELPGFIYPETCYCPQPDIQQWYSNMKCPASYKQIKNDLSLFKDVDLEKTAAETIQRFNISTAHSLCYYKIIDNKIYRKTYGQHVGFKMFSDAILLSLTKKVKLPDLEFFVNLGDWPLEKRKRTDNPLPIFSWCGSDESLDIVMPTYDLTEATLEMLGRQSLDVFSVMGKSPTRWENKTEIGFWRGRDSRQERLDLVVMSRKNPDLLHAKMTRMFFFKHDEEKYGELVNNIPFFDFFKYKYQVNIDGTVAAYRLPYLLAGDSVVLKQDSFYYEHFYKDLKPYVHYIPFKRDLSDLLEKIKWAKENDEKVHEIARNAQNYVLENLLPKDIFCYHVKLFETYSKRFKSPPTKPDDSWELVEQPKDDSNCNCQLKEQPSKNKSKTKSKKDEL